MSGDIWTPPGGSADQPPEEPERERQASGRSSDEELMAQFQEELTRVKVVDLLVQTLYTVSSLGFHKLGAENRDLPQAHLSIEALRALLGVLADEAPADLLRDFEQVVANMQLAYADAVKQERTPEDSPPATAEPEPIEDEELGGEG